VSARGLEECGEQSLPAAQVQDPAAPRKEAVLEDVGKRRIACELAAREVVRETSGRPVSHGRIVR
jgi:hypothetical protein